MNFKKKQLGLSLLELMVALGMIAVLSSISYTTYQKYAIRANRIEVRNAMDMIAQRLEQNFSITRDFQYYYDPQKPSNRAGEQIADPKEMLKKLGFETVNINKTTGEIGGDGDAVPVGVQGNRATYGINLAYIPANAQTSDGKKYGPGFYLQAEPVGRQTKDKCKFFYLNHRNVRKASNGDTDWAGIKARGGYTQECWQS